MSEETGNLAEKSQAEEGATSAPQSESLPASEGDASAENQQEQPVPESEPQIAEPPVGADSAEEELSASTEEVTATDGDELDDDVEMVARPTTFAPMTAEVEPEQQTKPADEPIEMNWYILKVQSNRERSVADALRRKIAIEGLDKYFDDVLVPTEKVTEFRAGKKKVVERKLYPGYIVVHMHINDDTWFAVRETSGIGDFTGSAGKPSPMLAHEVARIVHTEEEETAESPKLNIAFKLGDRVKIKEGTFESFEGEVSAIDEQSGRITVMINIFGRSTPVELEYWQAEKT